MEFCWMIGSLPMKHFAWQILLDSRTQKVWPVEYNIDTQQILETLPHNAVTSRCNSLRDPRIIAYTASTLGPQLFKLQSWMILGEKRRGGPIKKDDHDSTSHADRSTLLLFLSQNSKFCKCKMAHTWIIPVLAPKKTPALTARLVLLLQPTETKLCAH